MTITQAFAEVDRIRNDRTTSRGILAARVDSIGTWAAGQKKLTENLRRLLQECHQLRGRLETYSPLQDRFRNE